MFIHKYKDNILFLETFGFCGIDPDASLEEFFRLKLDEYEEDFEYFFDYTNRIRMFPKQ